MADYLILKRNPPDSLGNPPTGVGSWRVVNLVRNKTADVAGATAALNESFSGAGKYGILRADNARTVTMADAPPQITDDPAPVFNG